MTGSANGTVNGTATPAPTHKRPKHIADIASQFKQVKVGVVQCTPKLFSLQGSTDVVCEWIAKGAAEGCQLLLLPESTIPGYPRGLKFDATVGKRSEKSRDDWLMFWSNSFVVGSQQHHQIAAAVKAANMYTVVGVTERDEIGGSLHCCVLHFGKDGTLLGKHRKLKPTALERYVWGESGAEHLVSFNSKSLGRISGLVCWEHLMPLARTAIYKTGVEIWLAPTADARPQWQSIMTHIALEGRCFVLSSNQVCKKSDYPAEYQDEIKDEPEQMSAGGSVIIDPLGNILAGPLWNEEGLLTATLDFSQIARSKLDFDVIGHYARQDVFKLEVLGQMPPTVDVE